MDNIESKNPTFGERLFNLRFHTLKLSQTEFAKKYALPLGCIKDWEQDRTNPTASTRILIEVIKSNPELVAIASNQVRQDILHHRKQSQFPHKHLD